MRRIVSTLSASLDGYMEAADGDLSWTFPDEELHRYFNALEADFDTHFYGRRMWEGMVEFWPTADEDPDALPYIAEYAEIWRRMDKVVFSKTLEDAGEHGTLMREVDPDEIRRMKAQDGKNISLGGPTLAAAFLEHGLVDEVQLAMHPITLGGGRPMFPRAYATGSASWRRARSRPASSSCATHCGRRRSRRPAAGGQVLVRSLRG